MATLASETWTGATGAAWPAQWTKVGTSGTHTIQANTGQVATAATAYTPSTAYLSGMAAVADQEILLDIGFSSLNESYIMVALRTDGSISSDVQPNNGYYALLRTAQASIEVGRMAGGTKTILAAPAKTFTAGTRVNLRMRLIGAVLSVRAWNVGSAEPTTWDYTATDASPYLTAGKVTVGLNSGGAATSMAATFDNLVVTDGSSSTSAAASLTSGSSLTAAAAGGALAPLALDPSSPAPVDNSATYGSLTTASFTPPSGSLLVVNLGYDTDAGVGMAVAVSNSGAALPWKVIRQVDSTHNAGTSGGVYTAWAYLPTSRALTVTVTLNPTGYIAWLRVGVLTGAHQTSPIGAVGGTKTTSGTFAQSITTTVPNSWTWGVVSDWNGGPVPTVGPGCTRDAGAVASGSGGGLVTVTTIRRTATQPAAGTQELISNTAPSSSAWNVAIYEIKPAAGVLAAAAAGLTSSSALTAVPLATGATAAALSSSSSLAAAQAAAAAAAAVLVSSSALRAYIAAPATPFVYQPPIPDYSKPVEWRYIAQNLLTGEFLHWDVPLKREELTWDLSGPGALKATIDPVRPDLLGVDGQPILQEWQTAIYAEANGHIHWGGILQHSAFEGAAWSLECAGFTSYPHGIPYTGPYWARINYDPVAIFRAIWEHLQTQPDGNLGLEYVLPTDCPVRLGVPGIPGYTTYKAADGNFYKLTEMPAGSPVVLNARTNLAVAMNNTQATVTLTKLENFGQVPLNSLITVGQETVKLTGRSGLKLTVVRGQDGTTATNHAALIQVRYDLGTETQLVDPVPAEPYVLTWWEATDCGDEIGKLAQETPFDWSEEHFWDGDAIRHRVRVDYPRLGRKRESLAFVQGANITDVVSVARSGDDFANTVYGLGKGEGNAMLRAEVAHRDGRLRRAHVYTDKEAGTTARVSALARAEFNARQLLPEISQISVVDHPNARIGSWNIGDDILVKADLPWIGWTEIWCRVTSWSLDSDYSATLTVTRSDTFRYGPSGTPVA